MSASDSDSECTRPRRTKRKIVVKFEFDDSSSSSSKSFTNPESGRSRQKTSRNNKLSTSADSDSCSDIEPSPTGRRKMIRKSRTEPYIYETSGDSSDSSWSPNGAAESLNTANDATSNQIEPIPDTAPTMTGSTQLDDGFTTDTSSIDGASDKCPICLHSFRNQEIGKPDICEHSFCATCIEEWSKNVHTCPIDRKEFNLIVVRDQYENGKTLREIKVVAECVKLVDSDDLTYCEVCTNSNNEDRMLLCDGCNRGYHLDCLTPSLDEIPSGSWYCDYCFASEASTDDQDDINELIQEMEMEIGVPETRLRVRRTDDTPRITRTRQSERIRAAILSRIAPSRRHATSSVSSLGVPLPGPSRITTTTTTTTTSRVKRRSKRTRKTRRRKQRHRTYVVEYDVGNDNNKFAIETTTTRRVVRKRRTKYKRRSRRSINRSRQNITHPTPSSSTNCRNTQRNTMVNNSVSAIPQLHMFDDDNVLMYFSDENLDGQLDSVSDVRSGIDGETSLLAAALTRNRVGNTRTLRRQKGILSAVNSNLADHSSVDILSNIMDTMDRWHTMTKPSMVSKIKISADGKLSLEDKLVSDKKPAENAGPGSSDIIGAPMYPRGGGSGDGGNRFQNSGNFRGNSSNSGHTTNSGNSSNTGAATSSSSTSSGLFGFSIFGPRPDAATGSGGTSGSGRCGPNEFNNRFTTPQQRQRQGQFRPRMPFNQQRFPRNNKNINQSNFDTDNSPSTGSNINTPGGSSHIRPLLMDQQSTPTGTFFNQQRFPRSNNNTNINLYDDIPSSLSSEQNETPPIRPLFTTPTALNQSSGTSFNQPFSRNINSNQLYDDIPLSAASPIPTLNSSTTSRIRPLLSAPTTPIQSPGSLFSQPRFPRNFTNSSQRLYDDIPMSTASSPIPTINSTSMSQRPLLSSPMTQHQSPGNLFNHSLPFSRNNSNQGLHDNMPISTASSQISILNSSSIASQMRPLFPIPSILTQSSNTSFNQPNFPRNISSNSNQEIYDETSVSTNLNVSMPQLPTAHTSSGGMFTAFPSRPPNTFSLSPRTPFRNLRMPPPSMPYDYGMQSQMAPSPVGPPSICPPPVGPPPLGPLPVGPPPPVGPVPAPVQQLRIPPPPSSYSMSSSSYMQNQHVQQAMQIRSIVSMPPMCNTPQNYSNQSFESTGQHYSEQLRAPQLIGPVPMPNQNLLELKLDESYKNPRENSSSPLIGVVQGCSNEGEDFPLTTIMPLAAEDIPLPEPIETPKTAQNKWQRDLADYGSEEEDDCPNHNVYSAESMEVAKISENSESQTDPTSSASAAEPINSECIENDEDLVQLDDEEDIPDEIIPVDCQTGTNKTPDNETKYENDIVEKSSTKNDEEREKSPDTAEKQIKKNVLELYDDSDWEEWNAEKANEERQLSIKPTESNETNNAEVDEQIEDERSYTPCLDEQVQTSSVTEKTTEPVAVIKSSVDEMNKSKSKDEELDESVERATSGIGGMETELISDDGDEDILNEPAAPAKSTSDRNEKRSNEKKKEGKDIKDGKSKKKTAKDNFKKISKSNKDRNYRDKKFDKNKRKRRNRSHSESKSRSRSRSLSRSRSNSRLNNKENRGRPFRRNKFKRRGEKRKEIERYDVRNMIAERQPRTYKDKYGRDTSRPARSHTRSRSISPRRHRSRSLSRRRSRSMHSLSPKRRSLTPRKRSLSRRRTLSRRRSRPRRNSISRRRSLSRRQSLNRRRSISRKRSHSRERRNSLSRSFRRESLSPIGIGRQISPPAQRERTPSPSNIRFLNGKAPRLALRSRSLSFSSRLKVNKSPSPKRLTSKVKRKLKNRKKIIEKRPIKRKPKRRQASISPERSPMKKKVMEMDPIHEMIRSRSKSWDDQKKRSWSRSPGINPLNDPPNDNSWTPPIARQSESELLTVILKNKDLRRKKEKKRRADKRKEGQQKRDRRKQRDKDYEPPAPSKEVFASGDNILVSVSFNKEAASRQQPQQTTIVTVPASKDQLMAKRQLDPSIKRTKKSTGNRKRKKVDAKPVAIIDLDRSPFMEITPSPKAVIILSDSDHESNDKEQPNNKRPAIPASDSEANDSNIGARIQDINSKQASQPQSPTLDELSFEMATMGPKTPPEPPVKFSLPLKSKSKLRVVSNPLHDIVEEEQTPQTAVDENPIEKDIPPVQNKVGPNTPPESGPCSPDAYDPFEPTKSASASPDNREDICDSSPNDQENSHTPDTCVNSDEAKRQIAEKQVKPVDFAMALINSKASMDAAHSLLSSTLEGGIHETSIIDDDIEIISPKETIQDVQKQTSVSSIQVLSNVMISHPKEPIRIVTKPTPNTASLTPKQSPMKPKQTTSIISKLPLPKPIKNQANRQNGGNDENVEFDSPYSPDSSDYDDLFEPPPISPPIIQKKMSVKPVAKAIGSKGEILDELFGSASPIQKFPAFGGRARPTNRRHKKTAVKEWLLVNKRTQSGYGKLTEGEIKIIDELPSSAVELQVKDKFLRKIHRQERVVEEVKVVLKPHYNKKHVTKEEYKDILRRAVPKICHNRSGEINPKKIHALIEAYVRKFRQRKKTTATGTTNSFI